MITQSGKIIYEHFAKWMNTEVEPPTEQESDLARAASILQPGDVILVEGRSRVGRLIKSVSQTSWTHVAVYVGSIQDHRNHPLNKTLRKHWSGDHQTSLLLEAELGAGILLESTAKYNDFHVRICRPESLKPEDAAALLEHAINRMGAEYDVRQLFDLARLMLPWCLIPRRWRSTLFDKTKARSKTHTICSTLVAEAFYSVNFPIRPIINEDAQGKIQMNQVNPRLCTPKDFDISPYFRILKFPSIRVDQHGDYHALPWIADLDHGTHKIPTPDWLEISWAWSLKMKRLSTQFIKNLIQFPVSR